MAETAYIALGANLGEPLRQLAQALELIKQRYAILQTSPIYQSKPVGYENQADFYNMVIAISCTTSPQELLHDLQAIEHQLGRIRQQPNGPRTMDLDILFYGTQIINSSTLVIPHPRLHERDFVLVPLRDLQPDLRHPLLHQSMSELAKNLKNLAIVRQVLPV